MSTIHYANDTSMQSLDGATVAILGYGSQGHAHALNLKDSGAEVVVGLRSGSSSRETAEADGLRVASIAEAVQESSVVAVLLPDQTQAEVYRDEIEPGLSAGDLLLFAHGFNVHFGYIDPPEGVDVALVAPKAPGHRVREVFRQGAGTPGLVAVHHDATGQAQQRALAYAHGIGCTRAGVIETTFREETETDLFGEQAVLCGGVSALVRSGFDTLVEAGYQPEIAYFECLHELKLIVDLMYRGGLGAMWHSVSDTAEHGGYEGGSRIVTPEVEQEMRSMLKDIQQGDYARRWMDEYHRGGPEFGRRRAEEKQHPIEEVGKTLRTMMPFLEQEQKVEAVAETSAGG